MRVKEVCPSVSNLCALAGVTSDLEQGDALCLSSQVMGVLSEQVRNSTFLLQYSNTANNALINSE